MTEEESKKYYKEIFEKMEPFKKYDGEYIVKPIPICYDETFYQEVIIPNIIRCGGIPKKDLILNKTYIGDCRNANEAIWNGSYFMYFRNKFGHVYIEKIKHFEDDRIHDVFIPIEVKED